MSNEVDRLQSDVDALTRAVAALQDDLRNARRASGLHNSSVDNGSLRVTRNGDTTMALGVQYDGTSAPAVLVGPAPPAATRPAAVSAVGGATVAWDGFYVDDQDQTDVMLVAPMDFSHVEIHATKSALSQVETAATIVGTFDTSRGGQRFVPLPDGDQHYIRLVVRTLAGKRSRASVSRGVSAAIIDDQTPTEPPAASPGLSVSGLTKSLVVRATDPVADTTSLLYEVATDSGFTDVVLSVTSDSADLILSPLPERVDLYVRATASNIRGTAPTGPTSGPARTLTLEPVDIPALAGVIEEVGGITDDIADLVTGFVTEYAVTASETTPPNSGWSTDVPTRTPGTFIWTRTTVSRNDGSSATTTPALLTGNTGATGVGVIGTVVTYQVGSSGTSAPTGTWSSTPVATSAPGQYLWTRTITTYSNSTSATGYAIAAHGATGGTGGTGAAGRGISGSTVTYQVGSDGAVAPNGTWSASPVATSAPGQYLWTRTVTTYTDSTTSTSYSVSAHGATGAAGVGVTGTTVTYQVGSSGTTAPTGTWNASPVATSAPGQYLWVRTITTYSNSTTTTGYAVSAHGATGATGAAGNNGVGVTGTVVTYQVASSGTVAPTGTWSSTPVATSAPGQFLWTRTITSFSDSTSVTAYSVAAHGASGANGANGVGVTGTAVTYQVGSSGTTPPTGTWSSSVVATSAPGQYLWTRTITSYSDSSSTTSYAVSAHGATGAAGGTGPAGRGVAGAAVDYQVGSSGTTVPSGTWSSTPVATSASGQFLWTRTVTTYTDATSTTGYSVSAHGATGATGGTGAAGRGVSSTSVDYQVGSSGTSAPTGTWSSTPVATSAPGQFLWTRTITTYTDSSTITGYAISAHGATGATGGTGAAGRGVSSTAITYQVGSSGTTAPTGTWNASPVATSAPGQFLWTRTIITYTDASTATSYSISAHGATGATGGTGATGTSVTAITPYYLRQSDAAAAPAKPTADPPGGSWVTTEPAWVAGTALYRTDKVTFSTGAFAYTDVTKVATFTGLGDVQGNITRKIQYGTAAPVNGTTIGAVGDLYYVRSATGMLQSIYEATAANTWAQRFLAETAIDTLSVSKITGLQSTLSGLSGDLSRVHLLDPSPTLTSNTGTGAISWTAFALKYGGISLAIAAASTASRWVVYRWGNGSPSVQTTDEAQPTLAPGDFLLFSNINGVGFRVFSTVMIDGDVVINGSLATDALAVGAVTGEKIKGREIDAQHLVATLILATRIAVGPTQNVVLSPTDGIVITTSAGLIKLPTDGSPAQFAGEIQAKSIEVNNPDSGGVGMNLRGTVNYLAGLFTASAGINNPSSAPALSAYWPRTPLSTAANGGYITGADALVRSPNVIGARLYTFYWNTTTSVQVNEVSANGVTAYGSTTLNFPRNVSLSFQVLRYYNQSTSADEYITIGADTSGSVLIRRYNANFSAQIGSDINITLTGRNAYTSFAACIDVVVGTSAAPLIRFFYHRASDNKICSITYTMAGVAGTTSVTSLTYTALQFTFAREWDSTNSALTFDVADEKGVWYRYKISSTSLLPQTPTLASAPAHVDAAYIARYYENGTLTGITQVDDSDAWQYDTAALAETMQVGYSWYDSDTAGAFGAGGESLVSPFGIMELPAGAFVKVDHPNVPDGGDPDDPNTVRMYARTGGTGNYTRMDLTQTEGAVLSPTSWYFRRPGSPPSSSPLPTGNAFNDRGGAIGRYQSSKADTIGGASASQPLIDLPGTGAFRVGPILGKANGRLDMDRCQVYMSSNTTVPGGTWYDQGTSIVEFDNNSMASNPSGVARITIKRKGRYRVFARSHWTLMGSSNVRGLIIKRYNSAGTALTDIDEQYVLSIASTQDTTILAGRDVDLNVGDYITVQHRQQSGGNLVLKGALPHYTAFGVEAIEHFA